MNYIACSYNGFLLVEITEETNELDIKVRLKHSN